MKKALIAMVVALAASYGMSAQITWAILPGNLFETDGLTPLSGEAFLVYGTDIAGAAAAIEAGTWDPLTDSTGSDSLIAGGSSGGTVTSTVAVTPEPLPSQTLTDDFFFVVFDDAFANDPANYLIGAVTSMSVSADNIPTTANILNASASFGSSTWQPVPEPGTMALALAGLSGLVVRLRRRRK